MHHFYVFIVLEIGKEIAANKNKDIFHSFCRKIQSEQLRAKKTSQYKQGSEGDIVLKINLMYLRN